jgi:hypothetical protein
VSLLEDIDQLAATASNRRGPKCGVCALPADIRDALRHGVGRVTYEDLSQRFLKPRGHNIGADALSRHFRQGHEDRSE